METSALLEGGERNLSLTPLYEKATGCLIPKKEESSIFPLFYIDVRIKGGKHEESS